MWGKLSCLRKQHDGRDWASNHRPSNLKSNPLTTTHPRPPQPGQPSIFLTVCLSLVLIYTKIQLQTAPVCLSDLCMVNRRHCTWLILSKALRSPKEMINLFCSTAVTVYFTLVRIASRKV